MSTAVMDCLIMGGWLVIMSGICATMDFINKRAEKRAAKQTGATRINPTK